MMGATLTTVKEGYYYNCEGYKSEQGLKCTGIKTEDQVLILLSQFRQQ